MEKNPVNKNPLIASPPTTDFLASAAWCGSLSGVQFYINKLPETINELSAGRTPVLWAISKGRSDVMIMLEKYGADITKKTEEGDSALACAVWSGQAKMVQMVLEKGIDPAETGVHGKTALDWAREGGRGDIIELLKEPTRVAVLAIRQHELNALARKKKFNIKP